VLRKQLVIDC